MLRFEALKTPTKLAAVANISAPVASFPGSLKYAKLCYAVFWTSS